MKLHIPVWLLQRRKADLRVEPVRVAGQQRPTTQALQRRMLHDALHHPLCQTMSTKRFQHKHVADVGVSGEVRNHPRKADLLTVRIHAKTQRVLDRSGYGFARNALGPITFGEKSMNHIEIEALRSEERR